MVIFPLSVETLAHGGRGVGRSPDGKVCFVPYTAPGDWVTVRSVRERGGYREAELLAVDTPSKERVDPPCPRFGICGGCQWQHLSHRSQTRWKRRILEGFLGRLPLSFVPLVEVVEAPRPWGYRHRAQVKLRVVRGELLAGFHAAGSHRIVPLPEGGCPVLTPLLNRIVDLVVRIISRSPAPGTVPQVDVAHGDGDDPVVVVHLLERGGEGMPAFLSESFASDLPECSLMIQRGRKNSLALLRGDGALSYRLGEDRSSPSLRVSGGGFFQGNLSQNRRMVAVVAEMVDSLSPSSLLDLYCGNGNFSLAAAAATTRVTGVEEYGGGIADARLNGVALGIEPELIVSDAAEAVTRFVSDGRRFDLVIVDPPRTGALEVYRMLPALGPKAVISISCDPATQLRDLRSLVDAGYRMERAIMVDLFPQTFHVESIVLMKRGSTP